MIRSFIEFMLGDVGRQILYFYEANALSINLIVLTYGLVILMSWTTLVRIYRQLVVMIATAIHKHPDLNRKSTVKRVRDTIDIPWQEAVDTARFPLVSHVGGLIPKRKSVEVVQKFFDEDDLINSAFELLKGTPIRRITPTYRQIRRRELEQAAKANEED